MGAECILHKIAPKAWLIHDFKNRKRPQDSADSRISEGADGNGSNGGGVKRPPESQLKKIPDNNKIPKWLSKGKQWYYVIQIFWTFEKTEINLCYSFTFLVSKKRLDTEVELFI